MTKQMHVQFSKKNLMKSRIILSRIFLLIGAKLKIFVRRVGINSEFISNFAFNLKFTFFL